MARESWSRGGRLAGLRGWLGSPRGQTTTEWLMIAGILTATAIFMLGIFPAAIRAYMRSIALSIRTIAP